MNKLQVVQLYRDNGFTPFALSPISKEPHAGVPLSQADRVPFSKDDNIGLFVGSPNNLAVIDADDDATVAEVGRRLVDLGLYDWTTVVMTPKRQGRHFWIKVIDVPEYTQAYFRLPKHIGKGEIRVKRPAYVLAPGSVLEQGTYMFVQGGGLRFTEQPTLPWNELTWLLPPHAFSTNGYTKHGNGNILENPLTFPHRNNPPVLRLFEYLRSARRGGEVQRINVRTGTVSEGDTYPSRSEAEASLVSGLIVAGWDFDAIHDRFETEQPGHYAEAKNPYRYLVSTYNKALAYVIDCEEDKS